MSEFLKEYDMEHWTPKTDKFKYVTKSMIMSYQFCPMQFYRQYILKEPFVETYQIIVGKRQHDYYDQFFKNIDSIPPSIWHDTIPDEFNDDERRMALNFLCREDERYQSMDYEHFIPFATELWCQNETYKIRGYIDRIDWVSKDDNELMLVEYKTGRSFKASSLRQELAFYSVMFNAVTDNKYEVTKTSCFNPNCEKYEEWKLNTRDIRNVIKKWNKLLDAIEADDYDNFKKNDFKCRMCGRCK